MKQPKFPDRLYIEIDSDGEPLAWKDDDAFEHGTAVAIYKLVAVKKAKVVRSLE